VVDALPVNPKQAASFAFTGAVVDGGSSEQQQPAPQDSADLPVVPPATPGGSFGPSEAREALLAWGGAAPDKASVAWVANHFKWVVWKLSAYDRKLLALTDSSSSNSITAAAAEDGPEGQQQQAGPGSPRTSCCLSAAAVLAQLAVRYTREFREGERSVLTKVRACRGGRGTELLLCMRGQVAVS
jgi:hypothetical protein